MDSIITLIAQLLPFSFSSFTVLLGTFAVVVTLLTSCVLSVLAMLQAG